jgi:hypothetical protein
MNLPNPYLKGNTSLELIEDFMENWGLDPKSPSDRNQLATSLNLSVETVNHWFINGRSRRTPTALVIDHLRSLHAFYYQKLLLDNVYPIHWISSYESLKEKRSAKFLK